MYFVVVFRNYSYDYSPTSNAVHICRHFHVVLVDNSSINLEKIAPLSLLCSTRCYLSASCLLHSFGRSQIHRTHTKTQINFLTLCTIKRNSTPLHFSRQQERKRKTRTRTRTRRRI